MKDNVYDHHAVRFSEWVLSLIFLSKSHGISMLIRWRFSEHLEIVSRGEFTSDCEPLAANDIGWILDPNVNLSCP